MCMQQRSCRQEQQQLCNSAMSSVIGNVCVAVIFCSMINALYCWLCAFTVWLLSCDAFALLIITCYCCCCYCTSQINELRVHIDAMRLCNNSVHRWWSQQQCSSSCKVATCTWTVRLASTIQYYVLLCVHWQHVIAAASAVESGESCVHTRLLLHTS